MNPLKRGAVPQLGARTGRMTATDPLAWRQSSLEPAWVRAGSCDLLHGLRDLLVSASSAVGNQKPCKYLEEVGAARRRGGSSGNLCSTNGLFVHFLAEIPLVDIKELPRTRSGLQSYRNHLVMELLWLEQAIVSRKNVRPFPKQWGRVVGLDQLPRGWAGRCQHPSVFLL